MKTKLFLSISCLTLVFQICWGQQNKVISLFPEGTVLHSNVNYNNDTHAKHLLDIYLPPNSSKKVPVVIFVHGGGWVVNDKYADMGYMRRTVRDIVSKGYALVSIDYRFATQAIFPAQIQDCNRAISFLVDNAETYGLDTSLMAVMGFSAGGHLAAMMGLSKNEDIQDFFMPETTRDFSFKAIVNFYGPAELVLFPNAENPESPEALLLGATPVSRPDLAEKASPINYIDKDDPPTLLIHGEKDDMVDPRHSKLMSGWLSANGVKNELIIVKDAPHFGKMFDVNEVRYRVIDFLSEYLN
ncbi:hypothetical protein GCM10011414_24240 [Croceivirga lutea]|uniref:alpha/beta hydrolase n=1 Tax=Croceivirga lutea TaxID=1775167 RepID=UPI00163A9C85|nr:alpha/beta hydrolase [Croceivirga lutea]GGG53714.1 hypothetical protein GCM10011414_24240 [Croceivirga lutea]